MKVLLTRAAEDARDSAARLKRRGHAVVLSPVLEVRTLDARAPDGEFDAAMATSTHAFMGGAHRGFTHLPIYVVGERTAEAARADGFHVALVEEDAARLSTRLAGARPLRFVYFVGRSRKPLLEDALPRAGHGLTVVETYAAEPARALSEAGRAALRNGALDAVLHYSPRSAEIFATLVSREGLADAARRLRHVAISQDGAAPLRARGFEAIVAGAPNEDAMFSALENDRP